MIHIVEKLNRAILIRNGENQITEMVVVFEFIAVGT